MTADGASQRRYWRLDYADSDRQPTPEELEERLRELIWEATRIRLISEVPLGAFLSGGVDSSAVVAAMADQMSEPVKTFSIGFPRRGLRRVRVRRMVAERFATDHHEFVVEPHALEIMPKLARHYGEPFADPSAIPSFYLAEMTSRHVTVALNGDGGDESFAGYRRYVSSDMAAHFNWLPQPRAPAWRPSGARPWRSGHRRQRIRARVQRLARLLAMEPHDALRALDVAFPPHMRAEHAPARVPRRHRRVAPEDVIGDVWHGLVRDDRVDRMLDTDVNTYLPGDLLVKMDIATMAYSVEGRSPLLDHHLMEFAAALPASSSSAGPHGKVILSQRCAGSCPTRSWTGRRWASAFRCRRGSATSCATCRRRSCWASDARVHAYVRPAAIAQMIDEHHAGAPITRMRLWMLLQLELWHREVVEAPPLSSDR